MMRTPVFTRLPLCLRKTRSSLAAAVLLALAAMTAFASSHFQKLSASVNSDAQLVVSWTEVGLGSTDASYQLIGNGTAEWACVNHGGHVVGAPQFTTFADQVYEQATILTKNGKVNGTLTADAPQATMSCPNGLTAELFSVEYTNLVLYDLTHSTQTAVPDSARTFTTGIIP